MSGLFYRLAVKIRLAIFAIIVLQVAGCNSPDERAQSYFDSGMKLLAAQNYQQAAIQFRNALRLKKDLLPAWRGLAQSDEASHDWEGLVPVLRTIVDLDPKDEATRLKLARILVVGEAVDQALKLINEADEQDTDNASLLALKAIIHYKLKDNDSAVREAKAALKIEPENADALIVLAAFRLADNDPNGALQLLSSASLTRKDDLEVQLFKIKIYAQLKDYARLETLFRSLAELYPQEVMFRKQLVNLYIIQDRSEDAERELRAIAAADPHNSSSVIDLVRYLYRVKSAAAARAELAAHIDAGGDTFPYQLEMAEIDYNQGNIEESFKLLGTLANSASAANAVSAKIVLAELTLRQNNIAAAEKILADILAKDERNVVALKLRASIRLDRNQLDAAIADLRQALNDQPSSPDLMLLLATAYERSGSIDLADKEFADALKASELNSNVGLSYAAFLRRHNGADRAYDVLVKLANRWPNDVSVLSALAEAKLIRQDWAGAEAIAATMKQIGNSDGLADQILGTALSFDHKYDASIAAFKTAVAAAPSATQAMVGLVGTMVRAKRTDSAIAFLQSTLKANPSNAQAYVLLGDIELSNNKPDQAERNFKAAVERQPKSDIGYRALSNLYLRQKNFDAALGVIETGLKELPDSEALHLTLAGTLDQKGDYEAAIAEYDHMLKQRPGSMLVANNLASLLVDHRNDKDSLDRARSLVVSLQDSPVAQFKDTLGWVYYRQGDYEAASRLLEVAAASLPSAALVHYHLGMCYIGTGHYADASAQLKLALSLAPGSDLEGKIKVGLKSIVTQ